MSGICDLIPGSVIDATMFNPCGYSMNGMKADVSSGHFKHFFCGWKSFYVMWLFFFFLPLPLSREHTGLFTSPLNPSSPTSVSKPTSPKHRMMILSGEWSKSSSQENLSPHFLSIRWVFEECFAGPLWLALLAPSDWDGCLCRAPNVAASFLLHRSLRATSVSTASWHSSTITILSSQVTPSTASRINRAEAVWWGGGKRKGAAWQSPPPLHSASTSPPGVATTAQAACVVWWALALLYPPA